MAFENLVVGCFQNKEKRNLYEKMEQAHEALDGNSHACELRCMIGQKSEDRGMSDGDIKAKSSSLNIFSCISITPPINIKIKRL